MTSCRLVATGILSSKGQTYPDGFPCSHPGARQWIEKYLKEHGDWAELNKVCNARSRLSRRDAACKCTCKVTEILRSANCKKDFLVQGNMVCLMSSYESGLRKMENVLQEGGPLTMTKLREKLRQIVTEGEEVALGRTRKELKSTICKESVIFAREPLTGLVVLCGVHAVLDPSCCHSGMIQWIEQYLKEHTGWGSIDEMDKVKSELPLFRLSCHCTIRSLIFLPNIRKHFHVRGNTVVARSFYQSGLQKVANVLQKKGPRKLDELLLMLKKAEVLSKAELRAVGDNKKDLAETISKEPLMFQPLSQSGRVHLKTSSLKPCRHRAIIKWIKKYLEKQDGCVTISELTTASSKIPARDDVCRCEISNIVLDDKSSFEVQDNKVFLWSSFSSIYEIGIKKIEVFLQKKGPQPVGILLNMLKQEKIITPREEKIIGRNKKELAYTISREPGIFRFVSPPGVVMLRNNRHEDSNQVTKVVDYLEKYLRTCKTSDAKTLLNQVVRHESLSTGCIAGLKTLKKLLAAYPDRFLIRGDGSVSLTESRRCALGDTTKPHSCKRKGTSENSSRISTHEIVGVGQSAKETAQTRAHSSSTEDMNSSNSKPSDVIDRNNNPDAFSSHRQRAITNESCPSEPSIDLDRGLRFVRKLLESYGPMVLQDIHTSIVATFKLDEAARMILGRTPEELLSILLLQKDTFHVIPPSDLVVLCQTKQMRLNPWTTGLTKVQEYLIESRQLNQLVGFVRENLTAKERRVFGKNKKRVRGTIAHYQDIFLHHSGIISLRSAEGALSSQGKKKNRVRKRTSEVNLTEGMGDGKEGVNDGNPCKKQKYGPRSSTVVSPVVVHVVQTDEEWIEACQPLFESASSVVGIDCDSKWFVLRQWDGKVIATKIQRYLSPASSSSTITEPSLGTSVSSNQEQAAAKSESCANSQELAGEHVTSNKPGNIFHHLLLLLTSPTILKVVYDIQRICAVLCRKMQLSIDNVFDVKVANQLISHSSLFVPGPSSFTELCEMYSVSPSAVVHVSCPTPGGINAEDVAVLKNMGVMTCSLIPHFLHKMFRDMKVELLTEHNCIVEELCNAWGPGFYSGSFHPKDHHTTSLQEQGMSLTNTRMNNPHLRDPRVLCAE